ncbi:hypothetical protein [Pantoea sp. KPR_PJ]|uniref:hypothetical protein n=1 Tax=Pantoea sp. KPR_PJ TaxID=2738375 RepID=UPI0035270F1F
MSCVIIELKTNEARNYILLSGLMHWFESDILGGKSKKFKARRMATVQYGDAPPIIDDIDATKCIFRARSKFLVTRFLDENNLSAGDLIKLEKLAPYTYRFSKA